MNTDTPHIHFVTGKLAEHAVRVTVHELAQQWGFVYTVDVLPITVAALITPKWLMRHMHIPEHTDRVILPGHLADDLDEIRSCASVLVDCGPRNIRDLPTFFGQKRVLDAEYGSANVEILAEINHADRLTIDQLIQRANQLVQNGADVVDLGCTPGRRWQEVGSAVRELVSSGWRVSIDSFDPWEVRAACRAGAELVLSVNSSNREQAVEFGAEVVAIPDFPGDKNSFDETINFLEKMGVPARLDPILEPLGCGFARSLSGYMECRRTYPDSKMMMGIGNITELTDVDSAGINVLLIGICEELGIQSVLTTEVINWGRSSVKECDLARKLMHYAYRHKIPPKHIEPNLVMLRDTRVNEFDFDSLAALAKSIRDKNIRIFNSSGEIHAISAGVHVHNADPFLTMQQLLNSSIGASIDPSHAFYLGYEMAKAHTANTLGKQYEQDESLNWGFLTAREAPHRLPRTKPSER